MLDHRLDKPMVHRQSNDLDGNAVVFLYMTRVVQRRDKG